MFISNTAVQRAVEYVEYYNLTLLTDDTYKGWFVYAALDCIHSYSNGNKQIILWCHD